VANEIGNKMNKRIKELLAELDIDLYTDEGVMMTKILVRPKDLRQFAELIVGECILTIQMGITRDGHDTEKYQRSMKHIKQIEEHFGVEE
jgi:hypothetical protein